MQDGRIIFYNPQTGQGKIILKSQQKFDFSVDLWNDFDTVPETGILVECEIEDGMLTGLKSLQMSMPSSLANFQESELNINKDGPTYSVSQTLENYFKAVENTMGKPPEVVNTKAQLDYFLSRRFLMTAYNNLRSLDPSLHDHKKIKKKLGVLQDLHKAYYSITERVDIPELAFEMIFLRSQPEYLKFKSDKEKCIDNISILTRLISTLLPEIQKEEHNLKQVGNKKIKKELENKIKKLRGSYVDAIHDKANYEEELSELEDIKTIYTDKYFDSFASALSLLQMQYKNMLIKILNYKAYELDELIWKHAGRSKYIQKYFKFAGIEGDYSTETFLRYYLNTLDKAKINNEQKKLFKLLEHLENSKN